MVINETTVISVIPAIFEAVFFSIISVAVALKFTGVISGESENKIFFGGILLLLAITINAVLIFGYFQLEPLSLAFLGRNMFSYLSSVEIYREMMVVLSMVFQILFSILLTFSRRY
ncbi:MAG: hypothetical protein ACXADY_25945 [Candidatus Hodarchaeales archaeon]|jgi:hypothetical protein